MVRKYLVNRKFDLLAVLSVVMVLFLAGCGKTTSARASSGTTASSFTHASNRAIPSATLKHMPYGTATVSWDPVSKGLTAKIPLTGMPPTITHRAHMHAGSCVQQAGVEYPAHTVDDAAHGR